MDIQNGINNILITIIDKDYKSINKWLFIICKAIWHLMTAINKIEESRVLCESIILSIINTT